MDPRVLEAIQKNNIAEFETLVQGDKELVFHRELVDSSVLHEASKLGSTEIAGVILKLSPEMVVAQNNRGNTPFHEACRAGHVDMVRLMLGITPSVAYVLNSEEETPFFIACMMGHVDVVKIMLNSPWLAGVEQLGYPLHQAIAKNKTSTVRAILEARSQISWKIEKDGSLPMHYACENGNLEIISILLQSAPKSYCRVLDQAKVGSGRCGKLLRTYSSRHPSRGQPPRRKTSSYILVNQSWWKKGQWKFSSNRSGISPKNK